MVISVAVNYYRVCRTNLSQDSGIVLSWSYRHCVTEYMNNGEPKRRTATNALPAHMAGQNQMRQVAG